MLRRIGCFLNLSLQIVVKNNPHTAVNTNSEWIEWMNIEKMRFLLL